ncbi:hypothetical protein CSA56_14580 [candidate division KSB3 bacterium]|uniref:STAS/SEC14 domain-containing protein n=1 Tax=candidate division KSB3 bacterium TaxID=2044937 RepID=A0A2G6KAM3_9BACT|nr:MAG: hypothetical protein CSA56_14580 [candidate division KSB3 bacterium]
MSTLTYAKYPKCYDGTYTTLHDCSSEIPHLAIGIWKGFFQLSNQLFIDEMWKSLDFIREKKVVAMISDHSELKVVGQDVLDWVHDNWYSNAAKYGLRLEAALDPKSAIAKLSLQRMLDKANTGTIETSTFPDFQTAYDFCVQFLSEYTR